MIMSVFGIAFFVLFSFIGFAVIWLGMPGTMLVIGATLIYDLLVSSYVLPWTLYMTMFIFLAAGEYFDIFIAEWFEMGDDYKKYFRAFMAILMICAFLVALV